MRKQIGALYRRIFKKSALLLGFGRLPVVLNGTWVFLPLELWDGFRMIYEPYVAKEIDRGLRQGGTFVDVGAHIGLWSFYAARLKGVDVVAVEPSPTFRLLERAAAGYANILPIRVACGSVAGEMTFYAQGVSSLGTLNPEIAKAYDSLDGFGPGLPIEEKKVKVLTLDDIVSSQGISPSLVKVDVEWYELEVLRGAQKLLASEGVEWIIEVHPWQMGKTGTSEEELFALLGKHGYSTRVLNENPNSLYTILAER